MELEPIIKRLKYHASFENGSELLNELYKLSEDEKNEVEKILWREYSDGIEYKVGLFMLSTVLEGEKLQRFLFESIDRRLFAPRHMYGDQSTEVTEYLAGKLKRGEFSGEHRLEAIRCMCMSANEIAAQCLMSLFGSERETLSMLNGLTKTCGWVFDKQGEIRRLYSRRVTVLESYNIGSEEHEDAEVVSRIEKSPWRCGNCGKNLISGFSIPSKLLDNIRDKDKISDSDSISISTCIYCDEANDILTINTTGGEALFHSAQKHNDDLQEDGHLNKLTDGFYSSYSHGGWYKTAFPCSIPHGYSYIGGAPLHLVTDERFPCCPECGEAMAFVSEGMLDVFKKGATKVEQYFICPECDIICCKAGGISVR